MSRRLPVNDFEDRIDCFGEFDRSDQICFLHCSLSFECAAARERLQFWESHDDSLHSLGCPHSA